MTPDDFSSDRQLHDLPGAYALDALPADEVATFEAHLAECAACTDEVASLRHVTTGLAALSAEEPPAELRATVLDGITTVAQVEAPTRHDTATTPVTDSSDQVVSIRPDHVDEPPRTDGRPDHVAATATTADGDAEVVSLAEHRRLRWTTRLASGVAAALVLVVGAMGLWANDLSGQLRDRDQAAEQVATVLNAPDAELTNIEGSSLVRSASAGRAVFAAGSLPAPDDDEVLQMWVIDDSGASSAGLVPDPSTPTLLDIPVPSGVAVGVTVEPAGGSQQPTSDPVVVFET